MRVWVMGAGSIGMRRARILRDRGYDVHLSDVSPVMVAEAESQGFKTVPAHEGVDGAFVLICTPAGSDRLGQLHHALKWDAQAILVEKPVTMDEDAAFKMMDLVSERWRDVIFHGACNLRFTDAVNDFRMNQSADSRWMTLNLHMGQAAKFWSQTHTKIPLVLDSIHELDIARYILGGFEWTDGTTSEDYASIVSRHFHGGVSSIILDRFSDPPVRRISGQKRDGTAMLLEIDTDDRMYELEMAHVMECMVRGTQTTNPLDTAADTCIQAIRVVEGVPML